MRTFLLCLLLSAAAASTSACSLFLGEPEPGDPDAATLPDAALNGADAGEPPSHEDADEHQPLDAGLDAGPTDVPWVWDGRCGPDAGLDCSPAT